MNEPTRKQIGFDRKIEIAWLDAVAAQAAAGVSHDDARDYLWRLLDGIVAGDTTHTARGKTLTVLSRIWLNVPEQARELHDISLQVLRETRGDSRLPVHWAMMMAAYPFFLDVATNVGKLITMNGEVVLSQIVRRMLDAWGDRSTLPRATQRILRSMAQWKALQNGGIPGHYGPAEEQIEVKVDGAELLAMGVLIGLGRGMSAQQLLSHPALFPFSLRLSSNQLSNSQRLQLHRQGDRTDFVELSQ